MIRLWRWSVVYEGTLRAEDEEDARRAALDVHSLAGVSHIDVTPLDAYMNEQQDDESR